LDRKVAGVAGNMSWRGFETGEYLKKLTGDAGLLTYDEMRRSDHSVAVALRAIILPILQARFYMDPASKEKLDVDIAQIIEKNLFSGMSITWYDVIRHILLMLPFGFMILEKCWEFRDGKEYLAKLDPRLSTSICDSSTWIFDPVTKALIKVMQQGADGNMYPLPIEKILFFTHDKEGDNWTGIPLLRTVYKSWTIKGDAEKINIIGLDRYGVGIIICEMPEGCKVDSDEWKETGKTLAALCANEQAYLQVPFGSKVSILSAENKGVDALPTIKHYEEAITKAVLAQFVDLGTSGAGNRALGESFLNIFLLSLQAIANYICEVFNRFLIPEYVNYNWKVKEYPKLRVQEIKELDAETMATLKNAGLITYDLELENSIRKAKRLPEKKAEETAEERKPGEDPEDKGEKPAVKDGQVQEQPNLEKQKDEASMPDEVKASTGAHDRGLALSTKPEDFAFCDFRGMGLRLNDAAETYGRRMLQLKEAQRLDIVDQLLAGKTGPEIQLIRKKKEMLALLMEAYDAQHAAGGEDVRKEFQKQRPGFKLAAPKTKNSRLRTARDMYEVYAWQEVEGAASKLTGALAKEELNRIGEDLDEADLKKALDEVPVSDRTWLDMMAGAVNNGWNNGRDDEAEEYREEIDHCIYTSVMEIRSTCYRCEMKDGHEHELGDPEYETPNPECAGGDCCQCLTVYVMKAEALPEADYQRRG
jgi:hypothetical protein